MFFDGLLLFDRAEGLEFCVSLSELFVGDLHMF